MFRLRALTGFATALLLLGGCATKARQSWARASESSAVLYRHAAVAADHVIASQAGVEMLRRGGNAVDAAVATSFCLSVVRPYSCGLGGGGFMIIFMPESAVAPVKRVAINYRETAPAAVDADYYVRLAREGASRYGVHACGVPGTVAGLALALENYGTLDLKAVLAPAIRSAEEGFAADKSFVEAANTLRRDLEAHPEMKSLAGALWERLALSGEIKIGDIIRNPEQAKALRLIAERGPDAFYRGEIAEAIVEVMRAQGGAITLGDLARYRPVEVQPLVGSALEHELISMPPPSSGGVAMQQIFGVLERRQLDLLTADVPTDAAYVHLVVEATKHAFADRAEWLADPAFVEVPIDHLTGDAYLDELAQRIAMSRTSAPSEYGSMMAAPVDAGTSHLSVIDSSGMAVACTETINLPYGALVAIPGFGFALNNEMDDFTTIPGQPNAFGLRQSDLNLPAPGKRPLSSMSPTILAKDGRAVIVVGGSGGPRIITATTQAILNCVLFNMTPGEAVAAPRVHHQWMPDVLRMENKLVENEALASGLRKRGHELRETNDVGVVQLIRVTSDGIRAASDPRKGGAPAGY